MLHIETGVERGGEKAGRAADEWKETPDTRHPSFL